MANHEQRIKMQDTIHSAIAKMCEGNPGAMGALLEIYNANKVDPDNMMGTFGNILSLDTIGLYGTDIYVLWSDLCNKNIGKTIAMIRAVQLSILPAEKLRDACNRQDYSGRDIVNVDETYRLVKNRLPNFDKEPA